MNGPGPERRGRPPGSPKTGGRTAGTPNRTTLALREKLAKLGCDPAEELLKMARDSTTDIGLRAHIYSLFLRFTQPVPKPTDHVNADAATDGPKISTEDAIKWAQYIVDHFGPNATPQPDDGKQENEDTNEAGK